MKWGVTMTGAEFRQTLKDLGFNQSSFTRRLIALGDPRSYPTLLRSVQNYAAGASPLPGEMIVILGLMQRYAGARGPADTIKAGRPRKVQAEATAA